jgi:hypothetical protein
MLRQYTHIAYSIISDEDNQFDIEETFQEISEELEYYQQIQFVTAIQTYITSSTTMDEKSLSARQIKNLLPNIPDDLKDQVDQAIVTRIFPMIVEEFKSGLLRVYLNGLYRNSQNYQYINSSNGQRLLHANGTNRRYAQPEVPDRLAYQLSVSVQNDTHVQLLEHIMSIWTQRLISTSSNLILDAELNRCLDLIYSRTEVSSDLQNPLRRFLTFWAYRLSSLYGLLQTLST